VYDRIRRQHLHFNAAVPSRDRFRDASPTDSMKTLLALSLIILSPAAFAQGKVSLQNDSVHLAYWVGGAFNGQGVNSDRMDPGIAALGGLSVDLYMGTSSSQLFLYSSATFGTVQDSGDGRWLPQSVIANTNATTGAPQINCCVPIFLEVQIRDIGHAAPNIFTGDSTGFAAYGKSSLFNFTLASGPSYPPLWNPVEGNWPVGTFNMDSSSWGAGARGAIPVIVPEPTTNVSVMLLGGGNFNLICNPLNNTNNNITNLFRIASDGDMIFRWNPVIQDLDGVGDPVYSTFGGGWGHPFVLQPGEAIFYLNAGGANRMQRFVGEIVQTPYTNPVPFGTIAVRGNGLYNAYGSIIPVASNLTNVLAGLTPADGDTICFWNTSTQDFDPTMPVYSAFSQTWTPSRSVQPGIGFFYLRAGPNQMQWIRNFTMQ
jgi:hypothetical protein